MDTLADLGEFGLIARIRERVGARGDVVLGPGDDAALLRTAPETLAAADMLVEGIHFDFAYSAPADVGYKAIAVNVSDIAAMGGCARFALVALGAPPETLVATVEELVDGIADTAEAFGVAIAGGDVSAAPQVTVAVSVLGDLDGAPLVRRSGGRAGDLVCVTGALGAAAAGLALLRLAPGDIEAAALLERFPHLASAHRRPAVRRAAGPALARAGATAMIDVSDGLARDAAHVAEESRLALRVDGDRLPLAPGVAETAALLGADPVALAAGGGEDYELCVACAPGAFERLAAAVAPLPLTAVGELTDGDERILRHGDELLPLDRIGWEHFA